MCGDVFSRMAAGESGAVEECFARFGEYVRHLVSRTFANHSETDDLVQDIFFELWRHAHRFDASIAREPTFVTMITRRRIIDFQRKLLRTVPTIRITDDVPHKSGNVDAGLAIIEEAIHARAQFASLHPVERHVIELTIQEGLSQVEVAEKLGVPLGTVKSASRRGISRLRGLIQRNAHQHVGAWATNEPVPNCEVGGLLGTGRSKAKD